MKQNQFGIQVYLEYEKPVLIGYKYFGKVVRGSSAANNPQGVCDSSLGDS